MKYITKNSVYEVDEPNKKIRRISGINQPHRSFSLDGEWKTYHNVSLYMDGLLISWPDNTHTLTSTVQSNEEQEAA